MNCEKLIQLVREREEIYNLKHPNNRNRELIAGIWKDIAKKMKTSDVEAKNKWQNLRSNYMRERRKLKTIPPGAEAEAVKIGWPYFSLMSFLDGSLKTKRTLGRYPADGEELPASRASELDNFYEGVYGWQNEETNMVWDTEHRKLISPVTVTNSKEKIIKKSNLDDEEDKQYLKQHEKISLAIDNNDPDLLFFKSLLPQIKQLNSNENLSFKVEVAQLLLSKLQPASVSSSCSSSNIKEPKN